MRQDPTATPPEDPTAKSPEDPTATSSEDPIGLFTPTVDTSETPASRPRS
jgi:hypothetical protein